MRVDLPEISTLTLLRRARDRIDWEYSRPLDVESLAGSVHMSAHFSRQFCRAYGESPYQYLIIRRVERGMTLLRRGRLFCHRNLLCRRVQLTEYLQHALYRTGRRVPERLPRPGGALSAGNAPVRREADHETGQEREAPGVGAP